MTKKLLFLLFFGLIFLNLSLKAQKTPFEIGFGVDYGKILQHIPVMEPISKTNPYMLTASFGKLHLGADTTQNTGKNRNKNTSKNAWQQQYNYPKTEYSLMFLDFQNPVLGKTISASANFFIPFSKNKQKRSQIYVSGGFGLSYMTTVFDANTNPLNIAVSNRISYFMRVGLHHQYNITKNVGLRTSFHFSHNSNAANKLPNKGINVVSMSVGAVYLFNAENVIYKTQILPVFEKKWHLQAVLGVSPIETYVGQPKKDWVFNWGLYLAKDVSRLFRLSIGTDISWNTGIKRQIEKKFPLSTDTRPDYRRIGALIGGEVLFGRMSLHGQFGYYLYRNFQADTDLPTYHRYGLKYHIWDGFYTGVFVKTHIYIAESAELSLGYNFTFRKKNKQTN